MKRLGDPPTRPGESALWLEFTTPSSEEIAAFRARYDPAPKGAAETTASLWHLTALWMRANVDATINDAGYGFSPGVSALVSHRPVGPDARLRFRQTITSARASRSMAGWEIREAECDLLDDTDATVVSFACAFMSRRAGAD